jgi:hypothetical protein
MPKIAAADIDLTSHDPVVHFTGEPAPGDVAHRDLNAADLEYIARVRALQASGGEPVGQPTRGEIAGIANDLIAFGGFAAKAAPEPKPKAAKKGKAAPDAPTDEPAAPDAPAEGN